MDAHTVRDHHGVLTTVGMLQYTAREHGDNVALRIFRDGDYRELTYTELADRVDRMAAGLMRLGIGRGDKVSVLGENRPEWAIAYLAIHRTGATCVPLDSLLKAGEFRHIIADSGVQTVIVSGRFVTDILEVRELALEARGKACL